MYSGRGSVLGLVLNACLLIHSMVSLRATGIVVFDVLLVDTIVVFLLLLLLLFLLLLLLAQVVLRR